MKKNIFLIIANILIIQSAYSQFEEYSNKRMDKYFSRGNNIASLNGGQALDNFGYEISGRYDYFFRDGLSTGSYLTAYIDNPNFLYVGLGQNLRAYLFHYKFRPFIELNHEFIFGQNLILNIAPGAGISFAGVSNMLGIELLINYEIPYLNFSENSSSSYFMPTVGLNLQW